MLPTGSADEGLGVTENVSLAASSFPLSRLAPLVAPLAAPSIQQGNKNVFSSRTMPLGNFFDPLVGQESSVLSLCMEEGGSKHQPKDKNVKCFLSVPTVPSCIVIGKDKLTATYVAKGTHADVGVRLYGMGY